MNQTITAKIRDLMAAEDPRAATLNEKAVAAATRHLADECALVCDKIAGQVRDERMRQGAIRCADTIRTKYDRRRPERLE